MLPKNVSCVCSYFTFFKSYCDNLQKKKIKNDVQIKYMNLSEGMKRNNTQWNNKYISTKLIKLINYK